MLATSVKRRMAHWCAHGQWKLAGLLIGIMITECVLAEDRQFLLPVIFPYADCGSNHTLQEVSLHFRTADCSNPNTTHEYYHFSNNEGSLQQHRRTFYSPEAVVLLSVFPESAPEQLLIPYVYCDNHKSGVVVRVGSAPDVASIGTFVAPHYLQSLSLFPYTLEGETGDFQYHILQGVNQRNEKSGFIVATLYDDTNVSILPTRDVTAIRNGVSDIIYEYRANHYIRETYQKHEVLWLEMLNCKNAADTLTGTIVMSNKPIAVYTAKAECSGFDQFSDAARVIHQMPATKYWGKLFFGDTIAFQHVESFEIALHLVCESNSTVQIIWYEGTPYEGDNVTTSSENLTFTSAIAQTVSKDGSNITHFSITSQHSLLVVYEIYTSTNETEVLYSSVLLQPVEWFSHVQSIYQYPPHGSMGEQRHCISIVVHKEDFDTERILLVSKFNAFTQGVLNKTLQNFGSHYSVYETGQYALIHLDITAAGLDVDGRMVHTVQYKDMQAKLGATVYSVGSRSGLSYSNGYFRSEGDLKECYPGPVLPSRVLHITSSDTFNALTNTSTISATISLSKGDSFGLTVRTEQPVDSSSSTSSTTPLVSEGTTLVRLTKNPQLSVLPHSESTPTSVTEKVPPSGGGTHTLAVAMGATAGGMFLILVVFFCILIIFCRKSKRAQLHQRIQMHDWGRPKYLRLEEPPTAGCEFDVLLSFAEEDCPFVESSIYHPLSRRGYRVFWHHDDFIPGLSIEDNICRGIQKSRRIILVCTESFMKSAFCAMELHYSMVRQYQVGIRCIIAIIFDERYCPRGLQGLNYIKLSHGDLDEDEIEALIDRLSLGEPVQQVPTAEREQESPEVDCDSSQTTGEETELINNSPERQWNWISNVL